MSGQQAGGNSLRAGMPTGSRRGGFIAEAVGCSWKDAGASHRLPLLQHFAEVGFLLQLGLGAFRKYGAAGFDVSLLTE